MQKKPSGDLKFTKEIKFSNFDQVLEGDLFEKLKTSESLIVEKEARISYLENLLIKEKIESTKKIAILEDINKSFKKFYSQSRDFIIDSLSRISANQVCSKKSKSRVSISTSPLKFLHLDTATCHSPFSLRTVSTSPIPRILVSKSTSPLKVDLKLPPQSLKPKLPLKKRTRKGGKLKNN